MKKSTIIVIAFLAFGGGLFAFQTSAKKTGEPGKFKKYEVIHKSDGQMIVADTLIPVSSDFSPDDYLEHLGIQSDNVEIVGMPNLGGLSSSNLFVFESDDEFVWNGDESELEKTIEINISTDADGNTTYRKTVNGEDVPFDPEVDVKDLHFQHKDEAGFGDNKMIIKKIEIDGTGGEVMNFTEKVKCDSMDRKFFKEIEHGIVNLEIDINDTNSFKEFGERVIFIDHDEDVDTDGGEKVFISKRTVGHGHADENFTLVLVTEGIDKDGAIDEKIENNSLDIKLFPNPAQDQLTLSFQGDSKVKTQIEVLDLNGKIVFKESLGKTKGTVRKDIDISGLKSGMYFVKVKQGKSVSTEKLIVH